MAFNGFGLTIGRGAISCNVSEEGIPTHRYKSDTDTLAEIATADYFPDYLGASEIEVKVDDILIARGTDSVDTFTITALSPLTIEPQAEATGNVTGPVSSTLNAIPRYTDTTGKVLGSTGVTIDGSNNLTTTAQVNAGTLSVTTGSTVLGNTTAAAGNLVNIRAQDAVNVWLQADTANTISENIHPAVVFTQDGNNTMCRIGHDNDNQFRIDMGVGTGSPTSDFVITTGGTLTGGGVIDSFPSITPGSVKLTIPAASAANLVAEPGVTGTNFTLTPVASNPGSTTTLWVKSSNNHLMLGATDTGIIAS